MVDETSFAGLLSDDDSSRSIPRLPEVGEGTLAVLRRAGIFTARDVLNRRSLRTLRELDQVGKQCCVNGPSGTSPRQTSSISQNSAHNVERYSLLFVRW